ncbi:MULTISPECIES: Crp/Fnr family transcriptional regulator [unclassified Meridianimarinicoccus]|uniref:Crp/Fnr family transcriptional regulator n=1 Tax=unclassified Meridianimarinicoccus TaxID=2923344 RepID=UPI001868BBB7|nr:Crp/Fnr family transcriptional regulator [Fluviibacterium sp. MJW13]
MSWVEKFPGLSRLDPDLRRRLDRDGKVLKVPEGKVIFGPGSTADNLLLLISGTVRVQHLSDSGRQIVLYRINAGESCVMTTACLMAHDAYSAEGITESEIEAVAIPRATFDDLVARSPDFRSFVFEAYSRRIADLFLVIEEVAFQRIDIRLAQKLLDLAGQGDLVRATHQQLAGELGTAREVVSRQLQEFRRRDWITLSRGEIALSNVAAIRALAEA